jgi:cysteinyl-tRNA synthetase
VVEAICDDMNTPKLLAVLQGALTAWWENIYAIITWLEDNFLKIWLFETIIEEKFDIPVEVTALADQRVEAKKNKDYALADELRNKIEALWFQLKDTKDGYEITKN